MDYHISIQKEVLEAGKLQRHYSVHCGTAIKVRCWGVWHMNIGSD